MTSDIQLYFLGTGTSVGVPQIGCTCAVCRSDNPKNKRLRSSVLLVHGQTQVLIDSSPDLRQQALREGLDRLDAVVYTHEHLDHIAGFDDLRAFCWRREDRLPMYASPATMDRLKIMYPWAFGNDYRGYVRPDAREIDGPFTVGDMKFTAVPIRHANVHTNGYLIECGAARIGYACDMKEMTPEAWELWQNLDVLILDGLRYRQHTTHMSVDDTVAVIERLRPKQAFLTHMSHEIDYDVLVKYLPAHVAPAYDGLHLSVPTCR